jgi:GGDEF domain-containing protein
VLAEMPFAGDAIKLANAILKNLRQCMRLGTINFSVSIGIALVDQGMSFSESHRRAAKALQEARSSSSGRVFVFNPLEPAT